MRKVLKDTGQEFEIMIEDAEEEDLIDRTISLIEGINEKAVKHGLSPFDYEVEENEDRVLIQGSR